MFPKTEIVNIVIPTEDTKMGASFLFDFKAGDFTVIDGKIVKLKEIEAVKVWIEKILSTEKFKYSIYKKDGEEEYGVKLKDLINSDYPKEFIKIELEREIKEALSRNKDISNVHSFIFKQIKRNLNCSFTVETVYGATGGELKI